MLLALREWLLTYAGFAEKTLSLNCLQGKAGSVALLSTAARSVRHFLDGEKITQTVTVTGIEPFGEDLAVSAANLAWYQELSDWVDRQNRAKNFPQLGAGIRVLWMGMVSAPSPVTVYADGFARYSVELQLTYFKEAYG